MSEQNCLILGAGGSGTSMVAGSLSQSGYFMGEDQDGSKQGNPKGLFEDEEIDGINEALLSLVVPKMPR